ncbi:hypothetical protein COBT_003401 [Conglomerata obtusa]
MDDFDIINEELIEQANNLHKYATNKVICEQNKFRKLDDEHIKENSEIKQLKLICIDEKEVSKDIKLASKDLTDKEVNDIDNNNVNTNNEHLTLICKEIEEKESNNDENINFLDDKYKDTCSLNLKNEDISDSISKEYEAIDFYDFEKIKELDLFELNGLDKEDRMKIHKILKGHPQICSKTNTAGVMTIKLTRRTKRFIFTLKKINKDTTEACRIICSMLKVPYKNISFAGNKDKRAITYQQVSVEGCSFLSLYNLAKKINTNDGSLAIYNIRQCNNHLKLGELKGNRFCITIKKLESSINDDFWMDKINPNKLQDGFINYFGQQRFGKNLDNHIIGGLILKNDYEKAIEEIMSLRKSDNDNIKEAKELYFTGNYNESMKMFPFRYVVEKWICKCRNNKTNDKKVIFGIKKETLKLYLHAYQSFIFNNEINDEIENVGQANLLIDKSIELKIEENKHLKGGNRKIIEKAFDIKFVKSNNSITINFTLNSSCYATMALRELIGDSVVFAHNKTI